MTGQEHAEDRVVARFTRSPAGVTTVAERTVGGPEGEKVDPRLIGMSRKAGALQRRPPLSCHAGKSMMVVRSA
jgi:methyl coenzyme M reductase subunit D